MIQISDAEKAKWESGRYKKTLMISFPDMQLSIMEGGIYGESVTLKESLFDGNGALDVSGCISSSFSVEIRNQGYQFKGQRILAQIKIDNGNYMTLFNGYVDSVETVRDRSYQKLQCYDKLNYVGSKNVGYRISQLGDQFTIKSLRDTICQYVGITQMSATLPNDNVSVVNNYDSEVAFIDVLKSICQINGVFGIINRDGYLEYRKLAYWADYLPYPSNDIYPSSELFPGTIDTPNHEYIDAYQTIKYEDYTVEPIDKVVVRSGSSDAEYGEYGTGTNVIYIDNNLVEGLTDAVKDAIAENIYNNIYDISYRPFDGVAIGRPYVEVGDSVTYYVYDYSTGQAVSHLMTYNVLTRTLKGIQWLRDEYSASGDQYQPEIRLDGSAAAAEKAVEAVKGDISDIRQDISDIYANKQNFINSDILVPSQTGTEGDLCFKGTSGVSLKDLYRYENGAWVKVKFDNRITYTDQDDIVPGQTPLETGNIILVYE